MAEKDFSIRIPATPERMKLLEEKASERKLLFKIRDIMFKPVGIPLANYRPDQVCIRLREFIDETNPSTLLEIKTVKTDTGYTDEKRLLGEGKTLELLDRARELGYEQWGEMTTTSIEYKLDFGEGWAASVLSQEIVPVGIFLKIESLTQGGLERALELLSATQEERIEKNAAVLLAEKLSLLNS